MKKNTRISINKKIKGSMLQEVIATIVIMGLLAGASISVYTSVFSKAKSKEAEMELMKIQSSQRIYFYEYSTYTTDLKELSYDERKLISDGGTANYKIKIVEASKNNFKAVATSISDTDGDGVYNVWEIQKEGKPVQTVED